METTFTKKVLGATMEAIFNNCNLLNVKYYINLTMKNGEGVFNPQHTYNYQITVRHTEGTDAKILFAQAEKSKAPKFGFIVMLNLLSSTYEPVFREDEELMFFPTRKEAQAEIDDCVKETQEAKARGDMDSAYTQDDYTIMPATLLAEGIIEVNVDNVDYAMYRTDDDFKALYDFYNALPA